LANNSVASAEIVNGTIADIDVSATAAIAGTKISPDFGSQNIVTTGTVSGVGSGLTGLNASNLSTGTVPDARLSGNVVLTSGNQTIAGTKTFSSTIAGSVSGNAGTATTLQTARTIAGVSFNGSANIAIPFANIASKPTTISGYGITDAVTTAGNQTIGGVKTFSSPIIGSEPTLSTHLATKNYVDTLVTQGVTWKGPVESGNTIVGTWGACDAGKQSWTTYNKNDDIIYICDGANWLSIGSSASIPYATTTTPGKVQLAGDIGGTWNNVTINANAINSAKIADNTITASDIAANAIGNSELASNAVQSVNIVDGTITGADILNNTIDETEISDSFVARDSNLLDGVNSTQFLRSDVDDSLTAAIVVPTGNRDEGMFGTYASTLTQHIWSMGTAYRNSAAGTDFGNLYGLAYKHTNNPTGGTMAGGHQMVWAQNGNPTSAMGTNIWTSGQFIGNGASITNIA